MKQIRKTPEEMRTILLAEESMIGDEIISEIIVTKSGAIVFNIISNLENQFLNLILPNVGLPNKVSKPLWISEKYKTLRDVINSTERELLQVPNFGNFLLKELNFFLLTKGLKLREEE